MRCTLHHLLNLTLIGLCLSPGEMYGQTRAKAGLKDRNVLRELCGAIYWHQPVHPEQTGTDSEEQGLILWDHVRLKTVTERTWRDTHAQSPSPRSATRPCGPDSWLYVAELSHATGKRNNIQVLLLIQVPKINIMCGLVQKSSLFYLSSA